MTPDTDAVIARLAEDVHRWRERAERAEAQVQALIRQLGNGSITAQQLPDN